MRMYFILTSIGIVAATLCGAPLAWDGAGYLFSLLDKQKLFTPNNRLVNIPLQWPTLFLSHYTSNVTLLQIMFSLTYTAVPLLALFLSWWVVRYRYQPLFIWAALGIGLATLPGQFLFVSEATIALQLFWPVALAILTHMQLRTVPMVLLLVLAIGFSHPDAIGLFAFATALAFVIGLRYRAERLKLWLWALGFGLVTGVFLLRFLLTRSQYEGEQLSLVMLRWVFSVAVAGIPLFAIVCMMFAAIAVFVAPWLARNQKRETVLVMYGFELMSLLGIAVLLVVWAGIPRLWIFANKFTFIAPFTTIFLLGIAAIERLSLFPYAKELLWVEHWPHRRRTAQVVASVFSLVLCIQSLTWFNLTEQLRQALSQSSWSCVSIAPIWWLMKSPLGQFDAHYYTLLLQGRTPHKLLLYGDDCAGVMLNQDIELGLRQVFKRTQGWFELQPLQQQLLVERTTASGCWFIFASGWYRAEANNDDAWWRWSDGRAAQLQVFLPKAQHVLLSGRIQSARQSNVVDILINGQKQTTMAIQWTDLQPFTPVALTLKAGENTVQFVSHNPPINDRNRPIAIGVSGITLAADSNEVCVMHP